jgi:hypothetical protein
MSISVIVRTKRRHPSAHPRSQEQQTTAIDYAGINQAALTSIPALIQRWLPDGRREGSEWIARNPHRTDHHLGSFKVNMRTGRWARLRNRGQRRGPRQLGSLPVWSLAERGRLPDRADAWP